MNKLFKTSLVLSLIIAFTIPQVYVKAQIPIAVVDLEGKGISGTEASTLSDRLRDELFKTGKFKVMERGMMDQILEEQGFQISGCTSNECMVEIGQLVSVQQIVGGSIGKVGNVFSISARVISVETGEIITVSTYDYMGDIGGLLTQGMRNVAVQLSTGKALKSLTLPGQGEGTFYITSEPSGASIWIDDIKMDGTTPLLVENQFAVEHKIYVQKENYSAETTAQLEADDMKKVNLILKLGLGSLKVITTPFEASVYLDGDFKGNSPIIVKDIVAGEHSLRVNKAEYSTVIKNIKIKSNKMEEVQITLSELSTLYVTSNPSEALVLIDGKSAGKTPLTKKMSAGKYKVTVYQKDYYAKEMTIDLASGAKKDIHVDLDKCTGELAITSTPSFAYVYLDGNHKGQTPLQISDVITGSHSVKFQKKGYFPESEKVNIKINERSNVNMQLISIASVNNQIKSLKSIKNYSVIC